MNGDTMFLLAGAAALAGALFYTRRGRSIVAAATSAEPGLAGAMETIDVRAKAQAYEAVSDKLVTHRAGRYEAELLDALAPSGKAEKAK